MSRLDKRLKIKGRSSGRILERVVIVRRSLIHSPQFSALSCSARALLFEMHAMFNGTNNGKIFLSVRDATARLGFSDYKAAMAAFAELVQLGLTRETISASFAIKAGDVSRARAWHLNWIGGDGKCIGPDALPQLDFNSLTKTQKARITRRQKVLDAYLKNYQRGHFAVEDSTTLIARMAAVAAKGVEDCTTLTNENGGNPRLAVVGESPTYIEYHGGAGAMAVGWWAADAYLRSLAAIRVAALAACMGSQAGGIAPV